MDVERAITIIYVFESSCVCLNIDVESALVSAFSRGCQDFEIESKVMSAPIY